MKQKNLRSPLSFRDNKSVIKKQKQRTTPDYFTGRFYQTFKEI